MSQADAVRAYCNRTYVEPTRLVKATVFKIRAGDVHTALGLTSRMPLVCSAIGTKKFAEQFGLRRVSVEGPMQGASTIFTFEIEK